MEFRSGLLVQSSEVVLEWWMVLCRSALHPIGLDQNRGVLRVKAQGAAKIKRKGL
jgi:hypothetical protein